MRLNTKEFDINLSFIHQSTITKSVRLDKIPWKRISVEAAAIVASILLAFAIDAWWAELAEDRDEHEEEVGGEEAVDAEGDGDDLTGAGGDVGGRCVATLHG